MDIPGIDETHELINEAEILNPGKWIQHSYNTGKAAEYIALHDNDLDPENAYIVGCLHDIGRREVGVGMRHILVGYDYLLDQGFPDAARICLTHPFPVKDIYTIYGEWDCSPGSLAFIQDFVEGVEYSDYDRLIQLCDALSTADGFCLIEKRLIEAALRRGVKHNILPRWQAYFDIKDYFENKIGKSIYDVLPGVAETTFR